ncbi:hypothetical protein ACWD0J_32275 [Streptomyces sp. NPDC003011]
MALSLSVVLGILGSPGIANAADSVQLRVCDTGHTPITFWLAGTNQNGTSVNSRTWDVASDSCTVAAKYWWKLNTDLSVHYKRPGAEWKTEYVQVSESPVSLFS